MAGRKLTNATYNVSTDWQDETESKDIMKKGWYNIELDMTSTPVIAAGSSIDIDGVIYVYDSNETITDPGVSDGIIYVTVTATSTAFTSTALPDYDYDKKGYYGTSNERYVAKLSLTMGVWQLIRYYSDDLDKELDDNISDIASFLWKNMGTNGVTLTPATEQASSFFGHGVAISGDYFAIGHDHADATVANSGKVYVYQKLSGNIGDDVTTLTSPNAYNGGAYGYSVTMSGDYLAVGAVGETATQTSAGHVYVYERTTGNTWTNVTTLTSPNTETSGQFGYDVSMDGDYLVVSAIYEDAGALSSSGRVYVYQRTTGNTWTNVTTLTSPNVEAGGNFGYSVTISGDYLAIGAPFEDASSLTDAGYAYVYQRTTGNTWTNVTTLTSPNIVASSNFGTTVSMDGDYLAVGAIGETTTAVTYVGRAYIYQRTTGNTWTNVTTINQPYTNSLAHAYFGADISISGDYLAIGAYRATTGPHTDSGKIYMFYRNGGNTWTNLNTLESPNPTNAGYFGSYIGMDEDYMITGAYYEDPSSLSNAGRAYIYLLPINIGV